MNIDIRLHKEDLPDQLMLSDNIAIDCEFMGLNVERDNLCLVQISTGKNDAHIIQLNRDTYNAPNLKKILINKKISKIFHYARADLLFIKKYLEDKYETNLDQLIKNKVFSKIGAFSLTYNPRELRQINEIVPSEKDDYFRFSKIQGFVHDMGASMQGGIGGHAGLFGNAEDVAKVMYLFLNKGSYIDYEIFTSKSFELFNKRHFKKNRRGIGFDKPQLDDDVLSTCGCVSDQSFGHSGFTGTYAWADPKNNLIYVFLSNRTYPTMTNNKISENNIRTELHRLINDALN